MFLPGVLALCLRPFVLSSLMSEKHYSDKWTFLAFKSMSSGEGSGIPLQYSCLENPMDGRAWWAAVHGPSFHSIFLGIAFLRKLD